MKIKFVKNHRPKGQAADIPNYRAGEVHEFNGVVSEGYARKYVKLGYAVEHKDEPKPAKPEEPKVEAAVIGQRDPLVFRGKNDKFKK